MHSTRKNRVARALTLPHAGATEVERLIGGPGVCIRDECAGICNDIIEKERTPSR